MATPQQQALALMRRKARFQARVEWLGEQFAAGLQMTMQRRLRLCAQLLRDKTVINLSKPVRKVRKTRTVIDPETGAKRRKTTTVVDPKSRSKPGQFPRADTTRLMKDIFYEMVSPTMAVVGTTLDYGLRLELEMDRSFLRRTLLQMRPIIRDLLTRNVSGNASFGMS